MRTYLGSALVGLVALCAASGCATVTADKSGRGIPFNTPQPYLVVRHTKKPPQYGTRTTETVDSSGKTKTTTTEPCMLVDWQVETSYSIVYLPNQDDRYWLRLEAGMGAVQSKATFTDGWQLTGLEASVDSKTADNVKAIGAVLGTAAGISLFQGGTSQSALEIYRIDADGSFVCVFPDKKQGGTSPKPVTEIVPAPAG